MNNSSDSVVSKSAGNKLKVYVIKHDMGENWSLYHETIIKSIFFRPFTESIQITMTESTFTLGFEEGKKNRTFEV